MEGCQRQVSWKRYSQRVFTRIREKEYEKGRALKDALWKSKKAGSKVQDCRSVLATANVYLL
jgi:hypothetical protein